MQIKGSFGSYKIDSIRINTLKAQGPNFVFSIRVMPYFDSINGQTMVHNGYFKLFIQYVIYELLDYVIHYMAF